MERYKDFDAFRAETEAEPVKFTIRGEDFVLPPQMPAAVAIASVRLQREYGEGADIPAVELMEIALLLFGDNERQRLLGTGISVDELADIMHWLFEVYSGNRKGPTTNRAKKKTGARRTRSSKTGAG